MSKSTTISYLVNDAQVEIAMSYNTELSGDSHKISCTVQSRIIPNWLQLRKFEMLSLKEKNKYTPLFNEINNGKNMATVLFIDKCYTEIMGIEKLKIMDLIGDAA